MNTKTIAYLRQPSIATEIDKIKSDILFLANANNLGQVQFTEENVSGTIHWKQRELGSIINSLCVGDNLILSDFSMFGRSMLECLEIITYCLDKKINLHSVKGAWRLDNHIQSNMAGMILSIATEIERALISKRTSDALRTRKQKGLPLGRPKGTGKSKLDEYKVEIIALLNNGSSKVFIAKRYKTSVGNLYHWLEKNNHLIKDNH